MRPAAILSLSFVLACSSNPPPNAGGNGEAEGREDDGGSVDHGSSHSEGTASSPDRPPPVGGDNEHEMTLSDCKALGEKYRDNTISDEVAKLDPKLSDAQRDKGREAISVGAGKLANKWIVSCEDNLVGKYTQEDALQCAMGSKTVAAFDTCLNGPPAPPPKK